MATPERIGSYDIIRRLGRGGMAEVFLAERGGPEQFKKRVAIKRLLRPLSAQRTFVNMFLDEARLVARLSHPNVAQLYELGEEDGQYFVAMEYVNGRNLADLLQACAAAHRPFPIYVAAKIVSYACDALHYAHELKDEAGTPLRIIHRDVSPQNVMLSDDGVVKVVDFGIAKAAVNYYQTQVGTLKGKLDYMSPEQIQRNVLLDRRADIFSLGAVLYELLSGRRPFDGDSDMAVMTAIVRNPPHALELADPELHGDLGQIAFKALAKDRSQRFDSARDMGAALERFLMARGELVDAGRLAACLRELAPPGAPPPPEPAPPHEVTEKLTRPADEPATRPLTPRAGRNGPAAAIPDPHEGSAPLAESAAEEPATVPSAPRPVAPGSHPPVRLLGGKGPWLAGAAGLAVVVTAAVAGWAFWQRPVPAPRTPPAVAPVAATPPAPAPGPAPVSSPSPIAVPEEAETTPAGADSVWTTSRRGTLIVHTDPPTDVFVDNRVAPAASLAGVELKPGLHNLLLVNTALGIRLRQPIQVKHGRTTTINKKLQRGSLMVLAFPYGQVFVDGKDHGLTPMDAPLALYEGEHTLRVVCERTTRENARPIQITAGETLQVKVDLR